MVESNVDIGELLDSWPYDPEHNVRVERLQDGREILQVRLPLGIEQYEVEGRPDGAMPHGMESLLDYHTSRRAKAMGKGVGFSLNAEECGGLFDEGVIYYYRYLRLFQLEDWQRVVRDTTRNLRLFDFVNQHASRPGDKSQLEKWRPYVMRMRAMALAMIELADGDHEGALRIVKEARSRIEALTSVDDPTFGFEKERSLDALREITAQLEQSRPLGEVDRLEKELRHAVKAEEFERAAKLRDRILVLKDSPAVD